MTLQFLPAVIFYNYAIIFMNDMNLFTSLLRWNIPLLVESPLFLNMFPPPHFLCLGNYCTSFKAQGQIKELIYF